MSWASSGGTQLEVLHDAQGMQVVVKKITVFAHGSVESFFASMAEGRMSDIVDQRERFDQIDIQAELRRDGSGDLRDFDGVGQPIAKMVRVTAREDLGFCLKTAERPGVDDAIAVTLKVVA